MPRQKQLDLRLTEIVTAHVTALVSAIERTVRRNLVGDLRGYLSANGAARLGLASPRPRHILPCIAPGCSNPSKGPRFHYLCEAHKGASRKDYEAWRRARRDVAR